MMVMNPYLGEINSENPFLKKSRASDRGWTSIRKKSDGISPLTLSGISQG